MRIKAGNTFDSAKNTTEQTRAAVKLLLKLNNVKTDQGKGVAPTEATSL